MKTSNSQFDLLITFMEQHGDLSKPTSNARGRISTIQLWEELTNLLNSDGSGDTKTTEKWKKVWSDYKNNTKKKAARLHKSVSGTGGGPAVLTKLSDLELRVLNLIGVQVATGLVLPERGTPVLPQRLESSQFNIPTEDLPTFPTQISVSPNRAASNSHQPWNEPGPSTREHVAPPATSQEQLMSPITVFQIVEDSLFSQSPMDHPPPPPLSSQAVENEVAVENEAVATPTRVVSPSRGHEVPPRPALMGQTPPRRGRQTRTRRSPRRIIRPAQTEEAAQHFLQADAEWRQMRAMQHNDYMDLKREQNRIREMELHSQMVWQSLAGRALDMIDKVVTKYCSK